MSAASLPAKRRLPRKVDIKRAIEAGRECGIEIGGYEIGDNGFIRVLAKHEVTTGNAYDRWKADRERS